MPSPGNEAQNRIIAEQVAEAAIELFVRRHPEVNGKEAAIPAPLKWAAGIVAALLAGIILAFFVWLASSVAEMQVTMGRMEERLDAQTKSIDVVTLDLSRRVTRLEGFHEPENSR